MRFIARPTQFNLIAHIWRDCGDVTRGHDCGDGSHLPVQSIPVLRTVPYLTSPPGFRIKIPAPPFRQASHSASL